MGQKHLHDNAYKRKLLPPRASSGYKVISHGVTMNSQIMEMTVVGWGKTATASWTFDRDNAGYAGQFIWTGTDYIGEPTPWHNQNKHAG